MTLVFESLDSQEAFMDSFNWFEDQPSVKVVVRANQSAIIVTLYRLPLERQRVIRETAESFGGYVPEIRA